MKPKYPFPLLLLSPAVFLTGATALMYEIVWTRHLALTLGSTTGATAAVLSAFMLGLALGALVVGRPADSSKKPLRWYGLLEIGIGIFALAFTTLLGMVGRSWALNCALIVLPAALMGATLPVLTRAAADTTAGGTRAFGSLYGINTLGAVAGALLATFVFLEPLGLSGTTTVAATINIVIGVLFLVLSGMAGERETFETEDPTAGRRRGDAEPAIILAFFIAGFAGLALQVAWVRLLVYFLEGFTIAFGLMLATYLLGLGGGALAGTWFAVRSQNPRRWLGRVLLMQGVAAIGTFLLVGSASARLETMRASYVTAEAIDDRYAVGLFFAASAIILLPTFFAGMLMPAVARVTLSDRESIASQTGTVYAASTLGAVIAPPLAGFWLVPTLSVPGTIAAMAALVLLAGTWIAFARGLKEWVVAGGAAVLFVALFLGADLKTPLVERSHVFDARKGPRRLVDFREGTMAGVSVVEDYRDGSRRLYVDGFSAAETSKHYGYMRMLGHLPVLLHPKPENALVIAFGTGTTAGAVAVHKEVKKVVCVEIEPRVYDMAQHFAAANRKVLDSPKVEAIVADGREFVQREGPAFDIITLEPLMPYTPGAVYLYTKEFYSDARKRLNRGGILCQWIPPQGVSNSDFRRLVRSMSDVFEHTSLWYFEHAAIVIGTDHPPMIDNLEYIRRCAQKEVLADLIQANVGGPDHLLGAHVVGGEALTKALGDAEAFVDDRTDLEFRPLPRRFGKRSHTYHTENLEFLAKHHQEKVVWLADKKNTSITANRLVNRQGFGLALRTLAVEMRRILDKGKVVPASVLETVIQRDPGGLFARSIYDRRRYAELMGEKKAAQAVTFRHAPDRSAAFVELAKDAEGERRRFYLTLAVHENALIDPALLRELAKGLPDKQKRFCLNRAAVQEGKPVEEGEEELPVAPTPDVQAALASGDKETALEALEMARGAGLEKDAEKQAWEWWQKSTDKRAATLFLHEIGSGKAMQAARRMRSDEDKAAMAVILAANYPRYRDWERLLAHRKALLRAAAADAAAGRAYADNARDFLLPLVPLLKDKDASVRLSAIVAFDQIMPGSHKKSGYNPEKPTQAAIDKLVGQVAGKAAAVR